MSEEIGYIGFSEEEYKKSYSDYTQNVKENIVISFNFSSIF